MRWIYCRTIKNEEISDIEKCSFTHLLWGKKNLCAQKTYPQWYYFLSINGRYVCFSSQKTLE